MNDVTRRCFLRSLGATVALPYLVSALPRAAWSASVSSPKRLIIFYTPNGIYMPNWTPSAPGPTLPATLPPILSPLSDVRSDILLLNGLSNHAAVTQYALTPPDGDGKDHHAMSTSTLLTGQVTFPGNPGADSFKTVDQAIAQSVGTQTRFNSLQLGLAQTYSCDSNDRGPFNCGHMQNLSWADPNTPLHPLTDPQSAFDLLFGSSSLSQGVSAAIAQQRRQAQKSVLDEVTGQISSLAGRLAAADKAKMDQYLTGVRDLENQLANSAGQQACSTPVLAAGQDLDTAMSNFSQILRIAFECDATRVATFMMDSSKSGRNYNFIGVNYSHHERSHSSDTASLTKIDTWEVQKFATLIKQLKGVDGQQENLLQNTAAVFLSEISTGGSHDPTNLPVLVAGQCGGYFTTNRQVTFADKPDLAGLHVHLLNAMGANVSTFGNMGATALSL